MNTLQQQSTPTRNGTGNDDGTPSASASGINSPEPASAVSAVSGFGGVKPLSILSREIGLSSSSSRSRKREGRSENDEMKVQSEDQESGLTSPDLGQDENRSREHNDSGDAGEKPSSSNSLQIGIMNEDGDVEQNDGNNRPKSRRGTSQGDDHQSSSSKLSSVPSFSKLTQIQKGARNGSSGSGISKMELDVDLKSEYDTNQDNKQNQQEESEDYTLQSPQFG